MDRGSSLFELIKSLDKSQKRYFRLSISSDSNNYALLFDAMDSLKNYSETQLRKKIDDKTILKNLASEKGYLYELLLRSMREYHQKKDLDALIHGYLQDIRFLYEKTLYKACKDRIRKSKQVAIDSEKYTYVLEILHWERKLIKYASSDKFINSMNRIVAERKEILEIILNEDFYQNAYELVFSYQKSGIKDKEGMLEEVKKLLTNPVFSSVEQAKTLRAKTLYYSTKVRCLGMMNDHAGAFLHSKWHVELYQTNPEYIIRDPKRYKTALYNLLNSFIDRIGEQDFNMYYAELQGLPSENISDEADRFDKLMFIKIRYHFSRLEVKAVLDMKEELESGFQKYLPYMDKTKQIAFYYNLAIAHFLNADYANALNYAERIVDLKMDSRVDIQHFVRILILIIHYEISPPKFVEHIYGVTYRYLYKYGLFNEFEGFVIAFIRKLRKIPDKLTLREELIGLDIQLDELKAKGVSTLGLEELSYWVKSKIQRKPMLEIMRSKPQQGLPQD
ncbi:MAG: hypothetical protein SFW35_14220 [Chitinophagales bacterium]|nr:hypothetical protein [Chitinophagales bacterium]